MLRALKRDLGREAEADKSKKHAGLYGEHARPAHSRHRHPRRPGRRPAIVDHVQTMTAPGAPIEAAVNPAIGDRARSSTAGARYMPSARPGWVGRSAPE
jgi:hypothetical protein